MVGNCASQLCYRLHYKICRYLLVADVHLDIKSVKIFFKKAVEMDEWILQPQNLLRRHKAKQIFFWTRLNKIKYILLNDHVYTSSYKYAVVFLSSCPCFYLLM